MRRALLFAAIVCVALSAAAQTSTPTFSKDIAPLLAANCTSCHHSGGIAPMPLMTYADVRPYAAKIRTVVEKREMPPWHAEGDRGVFSNDPRLAESDIETIVRWASNGAPGGSEKDLPKMPDYSRPWPLGQPDSVVQPAREYSITAEGSDEYRCFVIPNTSEQDQWVKAVDIRPGDPAVVHHAFIWIDRGTTAAGKDGADGKPGYSCFGGPGFNAMDNLGAWLPGQQIAALPNGVAYLWPANSRIVLQVHYHKNGKRTTDLTRIGLYFTKGPQKRLQSVPVLNPRFEIPPGNSNFEVRAAYTVPEDIDVVSILPHMHLLGKSMDVTANLPSGETISLIRVPHYQFHWQRTYTYRSPITLPKGTRISLVAIFDNSEGNANNPNSPPKPVRFGEATTDEMDVAYISYVMK